MTILTNSPSYAKTFETQGDAQNAAEEACYKLGFLSANTDQAIIDGKWIAVVTLDGNDFDHFVKA